MGIVSVDGYMYRLGGLVVLVIVYNNCPFRGRTGGPAASPRLFKAIATA